MTTACVTRLGWLLAGLLLVVSATAAESSYRQIADGVAVYFGMMPAELVRGHPQEHPEGQMHGGVPVGENHIMVALFEDKTGKRITRAEVTATITDSGNFNRLLKKSEKHPNPSFRRKPESSIVLISFILISWTPAFAGVTKSFSATC